jgi:hypothetical protein
MEESIAHPPASGHGVSNSAPGARRARAAGLLIGLVALLVGAPAVHGSGVPEVSDTSENEYKVKAAQLYHFIRYTTWPATCFEKESSPIVVLVVGEDPFGKHLDAALAGKEIDDRKVVLRRSQEVPEKPAAHLIFEGGLSHKEQARLLAVCEGRPILLFGDREGYARAGACVNFYLEKGKVRFAVNKNGAIARGLEISSQLLKLAHIVDTEEVDEQ